MVLSNNEDFPLDMVKEELINIKIRSLVRSVLVVS
jgi:hypothetical protein